MGSFGCIAVRKFESALTLQRSFAVCYRRDIIGELRDGSILARLAGWLTRSRGDRKWRGGLMAPISVVMTQEKHAIVAEKRAEGVIS